MESWIAKPGIETQYKNHYTGHIIVHTKCIARTTVQITYTSETIKNQTNHVLPNTLNS